jgi:cytochrome c-type biogenesis protein CcmF
MGGKGVLAPFGIGLGIWLILGSLVDAAERVRLFRVDPMTSLTRFLGLPRSALGTMLAHAGMGITLVGLVATSAYQTEEIAAMRPGETIDVAGYTLLFQGTSPSTGPNFRAERAQFSASRGGAAPVQLTASKRFYATRQMATTEAAIRTIGLSQLYVSLGDRTEDGALAVRASYKPLVTLIWLGALVMSLGGLLSLSDRRLRIGAPRRAASRPAETAPA